MIPAEPYNTENAKYGLAYDKVLRAVPNMVIASEAYYYGKHEESLAALDEVKDKYWHHPNFVRLYLLSTSSAEKVPEAAATFAHLLAIEPKAGWNPTVSALAEKVFDSDELAETFGDAIVMDQGKYSKIAMAWLIIRTKYDSTEQRLHRMIEVFDRLNNLHVDADGTKTETPSWMMRSVNVWRLSKRECENRKTQLTQLAKSKKNRTEIFENVLIPLDHQDSRECVGRRNRYDCNSCLREWLDGAVNEYLLETDPQEAIEHQKFVAAHHPKPAGSAEHQDNAAANAEAQAPAKDAEAAKDKDAAKDADAAADNANADAAEADTVQEDAADEAATN